MAVVSSEQLIAAVTAEADGQVLASCTAQQRGGEHRWVGKRFVPDLRKARYLRQRFCHGELN